MLGETIRDLRKVRGYSQETMAQQLNVVRQTVSKWEKGLSVPDADMLVRIADLFEVPVSQLLGEAQAGQEVPEDMNEVARQLAVLNEQLAAQRRGRRRILKWVLVALAALVLVPIVLFVVLVLGRVAYNGGSDMLLPAVNVSQIEDGVEAHAGEFGLSLVHDAG